MSEQGYIRDKLISSGISLAIKRTENAGRAAAVWKIIGHGAPKVFIILEHLEQNGVEIIFGLCYTHNRVLKGSILMT